MRILVDTNVLLRIAQVASPHRQAAKQALVALDDAKVVLCLVPQVIYEFWAAATRPISVNGLGMDPPSAEQSIQQLQRDFVLLRDERGIFPRWQSLVTAYQVRGKTAHDARLVAAMQRHGLTNLLQRAGLRPVFVDQRLFAGGSARRQAARLKRCINWFSRGASLRAERDAPDEVVMSPSEKSKQSAILKSAPRKASANPSERHGLKPELQQNHRSCANRICPGFAAGLAACSSCHFAQPSSRNLTNVPGIASFPM